MIQPSRPLLLALGIAGCGGGSAGSDGGPSSTGAVTNTSVTTQGGVDSTGTAARSRAPLVDHTLWVGVDEQQDPLADHRPALVECGVNGAFIEGLGLEIDTGACTYLARQQPSLAAVHAGDTIEVAAFHETLASIEAGQAHFAVTMGTGVLWQKFIPIPAAPGVVDATPFNDAIEIDVDIPAGTPVGLHLHNHGYNTWTLLHVEVIPAGAN